MTFRHASHPCAACPWVVGNEAGDIPGYDHDKAEALASTSPDERGFGPEFGAPIFACHASAPGKEIACAGWLATQGHAHPGVRLAAMTGDLDVAALTPKPSWPRLHTTFASLIEALRTTSSRITHSSRQ